MEEKGQAQQGAELLRKAQDAVQEAAAGVKAGAKKAAQKAGAELIVIARPKEEGKSLQEVKKLMEEFLAKENLL